MISVRTYPELLEYVENLIKNPLSRLYNLMKIDITVTDKPTLIHFIPEQKKISISVNIQDMREPLNLIFVSEKLNFYFTKYPANPINVVNLLSIFLDRFNVKNGIKYSNFYIETLATINFLEKYNQTPKHFKNYNLSRRYRGDKLVLSYLTIFENMTQDSVFTSDVVKDQGLLISRMDSMIKRLLNEVYKDFESETSIYQFIGFINSLNMKNLLSRFLGKRYEDIFFRDINSPSLFKMIFDIRLPRGDSFKESVEKLIEGITGGLKRDLSAAAPALSITLGKDEKKEIIKAWYRLRAVKELELFVEHDIERRDIEYGDVMSTWHIGDPVEKLDIYSSLQAFPKLIPNITTKKFQTEYKREIKKTTRKSPFKKILLILDSSGSMKGPLDEEKYYSYVEGKMKAKLLGLRYPFGSKFDGALITAFSILEFAKMQQLEIAVINFSGKARILDWSTNYGGIEDLLIEYQGNGTIFPYEEIFDLLTNVKQRVLIVIISDSLFFNKEEAIQSIKMFKSTIHKLIFFKISQMGEGDRDFLYEAYKAGWKIVEMNSLEDLLKFLTNPEPLIEISHV